MMWVMGDNGRLERILAIAMYNLSNKFVTITLAMGYDLIAKLLSTKVILLSDLPVAAWIADVPA